MFFILMGISLICGPFLQVQASQNTEAFDQVKRVINEIISHKGKVSEVNYLTAIARLDGELQKLVPEPTQLADEDKTHIKGVFKRIHNVFRSDFEKRVGSQLQTLEKLQKAYLKLLEIQKKYLGDTNDLNSSVYHLLGQIELKIASEKFLEEFYSDDEEDIGSAEEEVDSDEPPLQNLLHFFLAGHFNIGREDFEKVKDYFLKSLESSVSNDFRAKALQSLARHAFAGLQFIDSATDGPFHPEELSKMLEGIERLYTEAFSLKFKETQLKKIIERQKKFKIDLIHSSGELGVFYLYWHFQIVENKALDVKLPLENVKRKLALAMGAFESLRLAKLKKKNKDLIYLGAHGYEVLSFFEEISNHKDAAIQMLVNAKKLAQEIELEEARDFLLINVNERLRYLYMTTGQSEHATEIWVEIISSLLKRKCKNHFFSEAIDYVKKVFSEEDFNEQQKSIILNNLTSAVFDKIDEASDMHQGVLDSLFEVQKTFLPNDYHLHVQTLISIAEKVSSDFKTNAEEDIEKGIQYLDQAKVTAFEKMDLDLARTVILKLSDAYDVASTLHLKLYLEETYIENHKARAVDFAQARIETQKIYLDLVANDDLEMNLEYVEAHIDYSYILKQSNGLLLAKAVLEQIKQYYNKIKRADDQLTKDEIDVEERLLMQLRLVLKELQSTEAENKGKSGQLSEELQKIIERLSELALLALKLEDNQNKPNEFKSNKDEDCGEAYL